MEVKFYELDKALKDAVASSGKEVSVHCYAGGPFELDITCAKCEDMPGYAFYLWLQGEDATVDSTMDINNLGRLVRETFRDNGLSKELYDHFEIEESEMAKLEDIKNGQGFLFENRKSIYKKIYNESLELIPLYRPTEDIESLQNTIEEMYQEETGHKYSTSLYHFEGNDIYVVFCTLDWKGKEKYLEPIVSELMANGCPYKLLASTCKYGACIVITK